jgi:GxxExxY protein
MKTWKDAMPAEREYLHKELTREIIDSAMKVHNALGCGLLEKVYENALTWDLELKKKKVLPQQEFSVRYREKEVGFYYADIVIDDRVIVEVKSVERIDNVHRAQILNYLRISGLRVGLLFNFARPKLQFERFAV